MGRVVEVFAYRRPEDSSLFSCLCRHMHRHLAMFEPVDFVRFSRGLSKTTYRDDRVVNALSKWAAKRSAEFSFFDWERFFRCSSVECLSQPTERCVFLFHYPYCGDTFSILNCFQVYCGSGGAWC